MIETDFYILNQEQYDQLNTEAQSLGITLDHFLLEFCDIEGPLISLH
jgi:hypothetical protein